MPHKATLALMAYYLGFVADRNRNVAQKGQEVWNKGVLAQRNFIRNGKVERRLLLIRLRSRNTEISTHKQKC
jgi:hypothetical protein